MYVLSKQFIVLPPLKQQASHSATIYTYSVYSHRVFSINVIHREKERERKKGGWLWPNQARQAESQLFSWSHHGSILPKYLLPAFGSSLLPPSQGILLHSTGLFEFLALWTPAALLFNCHYNGHLVNLPELSSVSSIQKYWILRLILRDFFFSIDIEIEIEGFFFQYWYWYWNLYWGISFLVLKLKLISRNFCFQYWNWNWYRKISFLLLKLKLISQNFFSTSIEIEIDIDKLCFSVLVLILISRNFLFHIEIEIDIEEFQFCYWNANGIFKISIAHPWCETSKF